MPDVSHQDYFRGMVSELVKADGWANRTVIEKGDRTLVVVYGRHSSQAASDLLEQLRPAIARLDRSKWMIFVEGIASGLPLDMIPYPEVKKCLQIAEKDGVAAVFDPIINLGQKTVMAEFRKSRVAGGIGESIVVDHLIAMQYLDHGGDDPVVDMIAGNLDLEPDFVKQRIDLLMTPGRALDPYAKGVTNQIINKGLLDVSNRFSKSVLEYYLRKNPDKIYSLASIGGAHLPIFEDVSLGNIEKPASSAGKEDEFAEYLLSERKKQGQEELILQIGKLLTGKGKI